MLIKVRDYTGKIKNIIEGYLSHLTWIDTATKEKKKYTFATNPVVGEFSEKETTCAGAHFTFHIVTPLHVLEIILKKDRDNDGNVFYSEYKITMNHTKDFFTGAIYKDKDDWIPWFKTDMERALVYKEAEEK